MTAADTLNFTPLNALEAVVLDTETTGLDASSDRLVQIGAVILRGGEVHGEDCFETLVDPGLPIPPASTAIHGIEDKDVAGAPGPREALEGLIGFIGGRPVIGFSIAFDLQVLSREAAAAGLDWPQLRALDVRPLAQAATPPLADYSLDTLTAWAGIENAGRHSAMGDAQATAELFLHLLPLLRERKIRTLAEADHASRSMAQREATQRGEAPPPSARETARAALNLDSYAFATRVAEVMSAPPVILSGDSSLGEALELLIAKGISSVFVEDPGEAPGIVTERDLLRALAAGGAAVFGERRLAEIKSQPLQCVRSDDLIYRAIGRLDRLGIRHLGVRDRFGTLVGAVTSRNLLRHRTGATMALGDEIDAADGEAELGLAWSKVPAVAHSLMEQSVPVEATSNVISAEICALTKRAALLGEERLAAAGEGPPPHPYAVLVLGSAGRGESLISADQDNAIIVDSELLSPAEDAWYAALGGHIADILDGVGIVYCKGGVMAKNAVWRRSAPAWRAEIEDWVGRQRPEDLLNVDIFFDAVTVHGDEALGRGIWQYGFALGSKSASFQRALEATLAGWRAPLGLFGGFQTGADERVDVKLGGLFPIVSAARILAIKYGLPEHGTAARYRAAAAADKISGAVAESLIEAQRTIMAAILKQQLLDTDAGRSPSPKVDPRNLDKAERKALRDAVVRAGDAVQLVREGMF